MNPCSLILLQKKKTSDNLCSSFSIQQLKNYTKIQTNKQKKFSTDPAMPIYSGAAAMVMAMPGNDMPKKAMPGNIMPGMTMPGKARTKMSQTEGE